MKVSIIIPTYNRKELLHRVLDALRPQLPEEAGEAEIIVVDDGSTDGTAESLDQGTRLLRQTNQGPGTARNLGAREARGDIILFLDDDMVPLPGFLSAHLKAHEEHADPDFALAILGYPTWEAKTLQEARFYGHLNESGLYFAFGRIEDPEDLPFSYFYTCNMSLPRAVFLAHGGFDTDFPKAAHEDLEFGYRVMVVGRPGVPRLKLTLCRAARTLHCNPISMGQYLARERMIGRYASIFTRKHPELSSWLRTDQAESVTRDKPWSVHFMEMVGRFGDLTRLPLVPLFFYNRTRDWSYMQGIRDGVQETAARGTNSVRQTVRFGLK